MNRTCARCGFLFDGGEVNRLLPRELVHHEKSCAGAGSAAAERVRAKAKAKGKAKAKAGAASG